MLVEKKESKLKQIGVNLNAQGLKSLEYDISAAVNKLDLLRDAMDALKSKSFSTEGMTITRPDSQANLVDTPRVESVSASAMNYDPGAMAAVFGEAAARIKNYQQAIEEFGTGAGMALNSIDPAAQLAESSLENAAKQQPKVNYRFEQLPSGQTGVMIKSLCLRREQFTFGRCFFVCSC